MFPSVHIDNIFVDNIFKIVISGLISEQYAIQGCRYTCKTLTQKTF